MHGAMKKEKAPRGLFLHKRQSVALHHFLAAGLLAFLAGAALGAAFGAAFGLALEGAAAGAGTALSAVRWSRKALISAPSLFLRSVSFAMLALIFAIAFAVFDSGAFFGATFARAFTAFAGAFDFLFAVAFGAAFFAVAIRNFPFCVTVTMLWQPSIVAIFQNALPPVKKRWLEIL